MAFGEGLGGALRVGQADIDDTIGRARYRGVPETQPPPMKVVFSERRNAFNYCHGHRRNFDGSIAHSHACAPSSIREPRSIQSACTLRSEFVRSSSSIRDLEC